MKKLLYTLLLLPLLAMQCEKDDKTPDDNMGGGDTDTSMTDSLQAEIDKLPPITTTGEGTFACLLNGKAWIANSVPGKNGLFADYFEGNINFNGNRYNRNSSQLEDYIYIYTDHYNNIGEVKIEGTTTVENDGAALYIDAKNQCKYENSSARDKSAVYDGLVNITRFDSINRIMAGTFEFTTYITSENPCGDTLHFTNGRFDIKY